VRKSDPAEDRVGYAWPDALPRSARSAYQKTLALVDHIMAEAPSVLTQPFYEFLDVPLKILPTRASQDRIKLRRKKLLQQWHRFDPLVQLFRDWAATELGPVRRRRARRRTRPPYVPRTHRRNLIAASLKEIVHLVVHGHTPRESVMLATRYGDELSFRRLIELDKVFLTARFAREWFLSAQARHDAPFFRRLGAAARRDTLSNKGPYARFGIACYLLWFLGFENLGKRELFAFLQSQDFVWAPDLKTLDRRLSRIGIRSRARKGDKKR
jgi:hypothetical protein